MPKLDLHQLKTDCLTHQTKSHTERKKLQQSKLILKYQYQ